MIIFNLFVEIEKRLYKPEKFTVINQEEKSDTLANQSQTGTAL